MFSLELNVLLRVGQFELCVFSYRSHMFPVLDIQIYPLK